MIREPPSSRRPFSHTGCLIGWIILLVAACGPVPSATASPQQPLALATRTPSPSDTPANTNTPVPTDTATATNTLARTDTPTSVTEVKFQNGIKIFDIPGSTAKPVEFSSDAKLVFTGNAYGDYLEVQNANNPQQKGWVPAESVSNSPTNVKQLEASALNWTIVDNFTANGPVTRQNNTEFNQTTALDRIAVNGPFAIQLQFEGNGQNSALLFVGQEGAGYPSWTGTIRLEVGFYNGGFFLNLRNGDQVNSIPISIPADGIISLQFDQNGKQMRLIGSNGADLHSPIDTTAMGFTDGLFPQGEISQKTDLAPGSGMTIQKLAISQAPDGRFITEAEAKTTSIAQAQQTIAAKPTLPPTSPLPPPPTHENSYNFATFWNGQDQDGTQVAAPLDLTQRGANRKLRISQLQVGPSSVLIWSGTTSANKLV